MAEKKIIDQLGRVVTVKRQPSRIVSLVPSQTELLYDLGLDKTVVGVTKFCTYPAVWQTEKKIIGGTKTVDIEKIRQLNPDLIIGNKEENTQEVIAQLERIAPVWISDVRTLEDALQLILALGDLLGRQAKADELTQTISFSFDQLLPITHPIKTAYFIWKSPDYIAGKSTFIDAMMTACGFENVTHETRYPEWKDSFVSPDIVFLSSEPFPFTVKHVKAYQLIFPHAKIRLVDGAFFSWYGSRLRLAPAYFQQLITEVMNG